MIRYNIDCPGRSSLIHSPVTHIRCAAETYATKHCALKIFFERQGRSGLDRTEIFLSVLIHRSLELSEARLALGPLGTRRR